MQVRRIAPAAAGVALVAILAFAVTYALRSEPQRPAVPGGAAAVVVPPPGSAAVEQAPATLPVAADPVAAADARRVARERKQAHTRTAELRTLRHSRTVRARIRKMWLAGAIPRAEYEQARRTLYRASQTAERLRGARRAELFSALGLPGRLNDAGLLTSSRLPAVMLTVRRNTEFWATRRFPAAGRRMTFGRDVVVFAYEPGQGINIHMLATAGRVNAFARDCRKHCHRAAVRRALARLVELSSLRGGFRAWEYLYRFGGGTPPWISAISQGTAIQALARGTLALGEKKWQRYGRQALGAFERRAPVGVRGRAPAGSSYLMYSFDPSLQIINGFLQALNGLHDLAAVSGSGRARKLFHDGDKGARALLPRFDTGAWSLYLEGGHETDFNYHELTASFLRDLCRRTDSRFYCTAARRMNRYEVQPPRIGVGRLKGMRPRRPVQIGFSLSKVSDVRVAMASAHGATVLTRATFTRGGHAISWTPPRRGRYRLQIVATGLSGPRAMAVRDFTVHNPHRVRRRADSR